MTRTVFGITALVCGLTATAVPAQGVRQPAALRPAATRYTEYYRQPPAVEDPSPSDVAPPQPQSEEPVVELPTTSAPEGCDGCESSSACAAAASCDEPWRLFSELPGGLTLTGWIAAGATANAQPTVSRYNGPLSFNDRRELQANQTYAVLERVTDTSDRVLDFGMRIDLLYGTDYIFTQAVGLETRRDGAPKWNDGPFYGLAMPQVYGTLAVNDLTVRLGHFYTPHGYEVVPSIGNFFYSHAYTMQYGEPFTHTGGIGDWKVNDQWTLTGGLVNGWDRFDGVANLTHGLAGVKYVPEHERYSLFGMVIHGQEPNDLGDQSDRTLISLVFTFAVTERLDYVLQHDNGWQDAFFGPNAGNQDAEWYGLNQYLFYRINDCWKAGLRFEWFRDDDGVRVAGVRATNPYDGGSAGDFYEVTVGLNWMPTNNLRVRPEIRWDWYDGEGTLPFDDGTQDQQLTAAMDVVWQW